MTVEELMEKLAKYELEAEVELFILCDDGMAHGPLTSIKQEKKVEKCNLNHNHSRAIVRLEGHQ